MTKEMYEDLLERNRLQISELNTLTEEQDRHIVELEAQIEKMKSDVKANIKWADKNKNNQMYFKLNAMFNQWELRR
jgi:predicted RNase H-like nuclease (RuvC/YqgF family)